MTSLEVPRPEYWKKYGKAIGLFVLACTLLLGGFRGHGNENISMSPESLLGSARGSLSLDQVGPLLEKLKADDNIQRWEHIRQILTAVVTEFGKKSRGDKILRITIIEPINNYAFELDAFQGTASELAYVNGVSFSGTFRPSTNQSLISFGQEMIARASGSLGMIKEGNLALISVEAVNSGHPSAETINKLVIKEIDMSSPTMMWTCLDTLSVGTVGKTRRPLVRRAIYLVATDSYQMFAANFVREQNLSDFSPPEYSSDLPLEQLPEDKGVIQELLVFCE